VQRKQHSIRTDSVLIVLKGGLNIDGKVEDTLDHLGGVLEATVDVAEGELRPDIVLAGPGGSELRLAAL